MVMPTTKVTNIPIATTFPKGTLTKRPIRPVANEIRRRLPELRGDFFLGIRYLDQWLGREDKTEKSA